MKKRTTLGAVSLLTAALILQAGFVTTAQAKWNDQSGDLPGFANPTTIKVLGAVAVAGLVYLVARGGGGSDEATGTIEVKDAGTDDNASTKNLLSRPVSSTSSDAKSNSGLGIFMGLSTADARSAQPARGLQPSNIEVQMGFSLGF